MKNSRSVNYCANIPKKFQIYFWEIYNERKFSAQLSSVALITIVLNVSIKSKNINKFKIKFDLFLNWKTIPRKKISHNGFPSKWKMSYRKMKICLTSCNSFFYGGLVWSIKMINGILFPSFILFKGFLFFNEHFSDFAEN